MADKLLSIPERLDRLRAALVKSSHHNSEKGSVKRTLDEENPQATKAKSSWDKWGDAPLWDDHRYQP